MKQEEIEMRLWEYIDGACSSADREQIAQYIAQDAYWRLKYHELYALHSSIANSMEQDQPSMRFTRNVMDIVEKEYIAPAATQYINRGMLKGIAAFFMITVTSLLGYTFVTADWAASTPVFYSRLSNLHLDQLFNSVFLNRMIGINIVLALVLLDRVLYRRRTKKWKSTSTMINFI